MPSWNFHHLWPLSPTRPRLSGKRCRDLHIRGCGWSICPLLPYPIAAAYRCVLYFVCCLDRESKGEKIFTPPPVSVCLDSFSSHSHGLFFRLDLLYPAPAPAPRIPGRSTTAHADATVCTQLSPAVNCVTVYSPPHHHKRPVPHSGLALSQVQHLDLNSAAPPT